jgi:hypothetical protein
MYMNLYILSRRVVPLPPPFPPRQSSQRFFTTADRPSQPAQAVGVPRYCPRHLAQSRAGSCGTTACHRVQVLHGPTRPVTRPSCSRQHPGPIRAWARARGSAGHSGFRASRRSLGVPRGEGVTRSSPRSGAHSSRGCLRSSSSCRWAGSSQGGTLLQRGGPSSSTESRA